MAATIYAPGTGGEAGSESSAMVAMREISKGIAATRDTLPFVTDPDVLGDALCELVGLGTELDSLRLELVAQCETNGVPQSIGVRTVGQYVAARTNAVAADTNLDSRIAKWLRDYPVFADALERRDMTLRHINYLRTNLDNDRTSKLLRGDQQFFADLAAQTGFKEFKKACGYWLVTIDPDGKEPLDQLDKSGLTITVGSGGRVKIVIEADAITGDAFTKMIEQETAKVRTEDLANDVQRSTGQRRLAALFGLAQRGFKREDGSCPVPLLNIVMSQKVAEWTLNQLANPTDDPVPVHPLDIDGRCELINGQPVHPLLVAAVLGLHRFDIPALRRYVLAADSRILDFSYNARGAPEHLRTATMIEHRGECGTHGCDAPESWLQIDHVDPSSNGGQTELHNLQPNCQPDNLAKGAATGHTAWKDRPLPPRYRPRGNQSQDQDDDSD